MSVAVRCERLTAFLTSERGCLPQALEQQSVKALLPEFAGQSTEQLALEFDRDLQAKGQGEVCALYWSATT